MGKMPLLHSLSCLSPRGPGELNAGSQRKPREVKTKLARSLGINAKSILAWAPRPSKGNGLMSVYAEAAAVKLDNIKRDSLSKSQRDQSRSAAVKVWKEAKRSLCLAVCLFAVFGAVVCLCFWTLPDVQVSIRSVSKVSSLLAKLSGALTAWPPPKLLSVADFWEPF